jgi:D-Tyr-tRNAtyr deacylase
VADTKSGTRAGFSTAKSPVLAEALYDYFLSSIKLTHATVASVTIIVTLMTLREIIHRNFA